MKRDPQFNREFLDRLAYYVQFRHYDLMETLVEGFVATNGWTSAIDALHSLPYTIQFHRPWLYRGQKVYILGGKVRDALIHLLGLEQLVGIDCDLLEVFRDLSGCSLYEVRANAAL